MQFHYFDKMSVLCHKNCSRVWSKTNGPICMKFYVYLHLNINSCILLKKFPCCLKFLTFLTQLYRAKLRVIVPDYYTRRISELQWRIIILIFHTYNISYLKILLRFEIFKLLTFRNKIVNLIVQRSGLSLWVWYIYIYIYI